jgi:hypothetical protein
MRFFDLVNYKNENIGFTKTNLPQSYLNHLLNSIASEDQFVHYFLHYPNGDSRIVYDRHHLPNAIVQNTFFDIQNQSVDDVEKALWENFSEAMAIMFCTYGINRISNGSLKLKDVILVRKIKRNENFCQSFYDFLDGTYYFILGQKNSVHFYCNSNTLLEIESLSGNFEPSLKSFMLLSGLDIDVVNVNCGKKILLSEQFTDLYSKIEFVVNEWLDDGELYVGNIGESIQVTMSDINHFVVFDSQNFGIENRYLQGDQKINNMVADIQKSSQTRFNLDVYFSFDIKDKNKIVLLQWE